MTVSTREALTVIYDLCREEDIKVFISGSLKGAAITGLSTAAGGLLFGPVGLAVGGIIGGISSVIFARKPCKSAISIIQEMTPEKRHTLAQKIKQLFTSRSISSFSNLSPALKSSLKLLVLQIVVEFLIGLGYVVYKRFRKPVPIEKRTQDIISPEGRMQNENSI